jgi:hypothetical protein
MPDEDNEDNDDPQPTQVIGGSGASATLVFGDGSLVINASGEDFESVANYVSTEARYWLRKSDMVVVNEGDEIHQHIHREDK